MCKELHSGIIESLLTQSCNRFMDHKRLGVLKLCIGGFLDIQSVCIFTRAGDATQFCWSTEKIAKLPIHCHLYMPHWDVWQIEVKTYRNKSRFPEHQCYFIMIYSDLFWMDHQCSFKSYCLPWCADNGDRALSNTLVQNHPGFLLALKYGYCEGDNMIHTAFKSISGSLCQCVMVYHLLWAFLSFF